MKEALRKIFPFTSWKFEYEVAVCCIVKNEDRYLPEWIAYHRKIGVSHFFLYDNESAVPVEKLLAHLIAEQIVTVQLVKGKGIQMEVYRQCLLQHGKKCRWMAFIDADEFIVPKNLSGSLPIFLQGYSKYGGICINWLTFGSNGHLHRQDGQLRYFTRRTLKTHPINRHIKSIVQPRFVKTKKPPIDPHHFWFIKGKYCVNENFQRIRDAFSEHSSNLIQLNHYFIRSIEELKEKQARGRADIADSPRDIEYLYDIDKAAVIADETILELIAILEEARPR